MKNRDVIERLEADGWAPSRIKGSPHQFRHPLRPGLVTVPHPKAEIPKDTFLRIAKQAGWKKAEKINITVPRRVLHRIDSYAASHGETRSGFLTRAALAIVGHKAA